MKLALKALLQKLQKIEEEHDGLGDTNVRDHMGKHVRLAFLQPEKGFVPSGEYGLDPKANRKVAAALTAFCKAANAAAQRDGLTTFAQRVAAFQDTSVRTPGGGTYEDFFGTIEPDKEARRPPKRPPGRQDLGFEWNGTLDELCTALNGAGPWRWFLIRQYRVPFMETHPGDWLWGKIRAAKPPGPGFLALLETEPEALTGVDALVASFRSALKNIKAKKVRLIEPTPW